MTSAADPAFEHWLDTQLRHSARGMLASISPLSIVKHRPGFGQVIRPAAGAIVASPVLADWDPDPDYFFHWFRDSAIVVDALRLLHTDHPVDAQALTHLRDFTRFSLAGLTGALLFYCLSLTPSLLPRVWFLQAVMSGFAVAIGYAIGTFAGWLLRSLIPWRPNRAAARWPLVARLPRSC